MLLRTTHSHHPPRLSVLLASEAPIGVIFRRGPSKLVRVVLWDRANDRFEPGQWFKGRIYAENSDVSPDGRHLIYFAMGGVAWAMTETNGTWTAISTLPSLKADALWGQGDTWGGGGMFLSNETFWLDSDHNTFFIRDNSGLRRETYGSCRIHQSRMERDGWSRKKTSTAAPIFEKSIKNGWILRKMGWHHGYELEQPGRYRLTYPTWEWAEWDRNRFVWTDGGCLQAAHIETSNLGSICTLHDFNAMFPPEGSLE